MVEGNGSRPAKVARLLGRFRVDRIDDPLVLEELQEAALDFATRAVVQQRFLRRMAPAPVPAGPIEWLDAKALAALLHRSESTIRHMPRDKIPGRRQDRPGCKVEWNKEVVLRHLAKCSGQ